MCRFFLRRRGLVASVVAFFLGFSCWFLVGLVGECGGVVCELDSVFVCFYACFLFLSVFGWDCWLACCGWLVFLGFNVLFLFGEFDPGSGRTLAACLTHASRTLKPGFCWVDEWRTGE